MLLIKRLVLFLLVCTLLGVMYSIYALATVPTPERIVYGVSFNTPYARELELEWEQVYRAILTDLGVRHLRLAAHWPMVEPEQGVWNFDELDTQLALAAEYDTDVVFAVGRRLPRWPECHVPAWADGKTWDEQKKLIRTYLTTVIERYKDHPAIEYWQVENEPFLTVYAQEQCGSLDTAFLEEEIALVKELDPTREVLVTDSGNLGLWMGAYRRGDLFGTSVYLYLWNEQTGPIRSLLPPEAYVLKQAFMRTLFGKKETMLIELSVEPWLSQPIIDVPISTQLERMNVDRFDEVVEYAADTRLERQYLWGAEWWYWLKEVHGDPEMWDRARELYGTDV